MSLFCVNLYFFVEGCKTYKKTITECPKHLVTPVKSKKQLRSRKQWVCFVYNIYHNAYAFNNVDVQDLFIKAEK